MHHAAIPTTYNGINFRSRLEARWAAFFDLLGWQWEYEPEDLMGWIPDFVLIGARTDVLVEVKPIREEDGTFQEAAQKYQRAKDARELLILGTGPMFKNDRAYVGWLNEDHGDIDPGFTPSWDLAPIGRWSGSESEEKNTQDLIGFCHDSGSYRDRITGCYDGGCPPGDAAKEIKRLWDEAGNKIQWKAPR